MGALQGLLSDPKVLALIAPLLVGLAKQLTSKLPSWSLPVLSTVLGAVMSALAGGDVATGAAAGLAGVGVRELVDQAKKSVAKSA